VKGNRKKPKRRPEAKTRKQKEKGEVGLCLTKPAERDYIQIFYRWVQQQKEEQKQGAGGRAATMTRGSGVWGEGDFTELYPSARRWAHDR